MENILNVIHEKEYQHNYYVKNKKDSSAKKCPIGYYQDETKNIYYNQNNTCKQCSGGKTTATEGATSSSSCESTITCYRPSYATYVTDDGYACGMTGDDLCQPSSGNLYGCQSYQRRQHSSGKWYCYNYWYTCRYVSGAYRACMQNYGSSVTRASSLGCPRYYCTYSSNKPCNNPT